MARLPSATVRFFLKVAALVLSGSCAFSASPSVARPTGGSRPETGAASGPAERVVRAEPPTAAGEPASVAHGEPAATVAAAEPAAPEGARPTRTFVYGTASFYRAAMRLWEPFPYTFYCECPFDTESKQVASASCGFRPNQRFESRARRIEWEHIVPAARMFGARPCASDADREGSRRNWCREHDEEFRAMEGDLHNFAPAIGQLNAIRSNHPYGEVDGEPRAFGACDFEVEDRVAEPRDSIRGDIARRYFYLEAVWGLELTLAEREVFGRWAEADPADDFERAWNERVEALQGNRNPFVQ